MPDRRTNSFPFRASAIAAALTAAIAYALVDKIAAQGVLLGAISGIFGLRMMAASLRSAATLSPERMHRSMILGTYLRLPVYGLAIYLGYRMDPHALHGLFGALAGIMVVRYVPISHAIARSRASQKSNS